MKHAVESGDRTSGTQVARWSELEDRVPTYALVGDVDLVVIRYGEAVSVLYGRCLHRGALLSDGCVEGDTLICGVHGWDYRVDTGVNQYANDKVLQKFDAWIDAGTDAVMVDGDEVAAWEAKHPQPYQRDEYLGLYQDTTGTVAEPHNKYIQHLARNGLERWGRHGKVSAMGVPLIELPRWDDIQILTGQLARRPLLDDAPVETEVVIGPGADRPLTLDIPIFVADMSFGPLRLVAGQGAAGAGLPLQGRAGRQDRDGRPSAGSEGDGQDRRGAGARARPAGDQPRDLPGSRHGRRLPGRRGRRPPRERRQPDRLQALGAAHRG